MIKAAVLLVTGNATTSLITLARNLIVARLISVEDYGVAATFALTMAVVEMASHLGLQQLMVQDRAGDDPALQRGLQGFNLLRGLISGLLLLVLAHPLALFLGIPEVAWAYQVMALVPVARGLMHFDVERYKRAMRFGPAVLVELMPAALSVLAIWPLERLFGDWRVMLYAILGQVALMLVASHLLAERPYRPSFDRAVMGKGLRFGWPLLLNGVLLFASMHGEKLVVGREVGMAALGLFAMGFTLTLTPTLVLARSTQALFLTPLSRAQDEPARFDPLAHAAVQSGLANGLFVAVAVAAIGPSFVMLVLGAKYAALVPLITWLGILQAVRVFKTGAVTAAIARGRTGVATLSNLPRMVSLGASWAALIGGADLLTVVLIATAGEAAGFALSLVLLRRWVGVGLRPLLGPVLAAAAVLLAVAAHALWLVPEGATAQVLGAAGCAAALTMAVAGMGELRRAALRRLGRRAGA